MARPRKQARKRAARKMLPKGAKGGFILPYAGEENYRLGREFVEDPKAFLRRTGLRPRDLICRQEVHDAMARGEAFTEAVFALGGTAIDMKMLEPVKRLAAKHLGADYEVAVIPYGLKFRERVDFRAGGEGTVTGSGTITFCDKDVDTDT